MRKSRVQLVIPWAALIAGVAAILLSFTFSTSPRDATFDGEYWPIVVPFYLALPIGLASLRAERSGLASAGLRVAGWIAAAAGAAMTTYFLLSAFLREPPSQPAEWLNLAAPLTVLAAGAALVLRRRRTSTVPSTMAMQVAYLVNALLCLLAFAGEWQSGAWCALATALIYVEQIAWRPWRNAWSWRNSWSM
jgi:hypothetical protein